MCKILGVNTSGYHKYNKNIGRTDKDAILSVAMESILYESPFNDSYSGSTYAEQMALLQRITIRR